MLQTCIQSKDWCQTRLLIHDFLLVVDWIMKTSTSHGEHGIQWTAWVQPDDSDFSDNLALPFHTQQQMKGKTASVASAPASIGLNIHKGKSKKLKYDTASTNSITLNGETLEDMKSDKQRGSDADVKARIDKARIASLQLKNIWNSRGRERTVS